MHTIVIADDNVSFAEEMRNYFTDNTDFKVVGLAPDGVEAIKLVEKYKPDFLLLDIVMPELDGFGVLSALSAFDEKPKTIMVSGLATDGFVTKSLRLGASYFMAKPVITINLPNICAKCLRLPLPSPRRVKKRTKCLPA